jgi:signal peptidase I
VNLKKISRGNSLVESVLIIVIALALAFGIQAFVVKPYRIPSESMLPTLKVGQRVLVNRIGNALSDPHVGEIVVFHPPQGAVDQSPSCGAQVGPGLLCPAPTTRRASVNFIKRVVAGPGDTLAVKDGHVIRNGKLQKEPFIRLWSGRRLQLCGADQDSRRSLVHDGRQSWAVRRQPILGTDPKRLDHRRRLRHLLAPRPHRHPLARAPGVRRGGARAVAGCSRSTVASGCGSSRVPTRRDAGRWPGRSSPRRCCSTSPR